MPNRSVRKASPSDLIALAMRVQRYERMGRGERLEQAARLRDALATESNAPSSDLGRLIWLIDRHDDSSIDLRSRQARSALSLTSLIVCIFGLLSGLALAYAVFYYDGREPVNVVAVLGVFVVLQTLMLLCAILAALPRALVRSLPGMDGVQDALLLASPGRLALLGSHLLPQDMREALSAALGRTGAHQRIYGRVQLWAILRWSQFYALAVNLAAVATFLYLVFFSDLAFGWSTTLSIKPSQFHQVIHAMALPWSWHEQLTPSLELVERSRYFRGTPFNPEHRGAWWPFLITAMLSYGLLPRVIAFIVASYRLRYASGKALVATPGATALLTRLADAGSPTDVADDANRPGHEVDEPGMLGGTPIVIDWSGAASSAERAGKLLKLKPAAFEPAGGSRSVADDRRTLETVSRSITDNGIVVLVKLWEPPLIETTEYLRELRSAIGDNVPVRVVPVASDRDGNVIGNRAVLLEPWRNRVTSLGDPWTQVTEPVGMPYKEQADD